MTTVLKLGGSVITDKDSPETVDGDALDRAAEIVGEGLSDGAAERIAIVHGGGSFGHYHASEHGVSTDEGTRDPEAVLAIHTAMTTLNRFVVDRLTARDVPAIPVAPLSAAHRDTEGALSFPSGAVETLLEEGFVPVLHGDLIAHAGAGATVLSGDEIVASLAASLDADRVGVCSTVPGVLDDDGDVIDHIERYEDVAEALGESAATDVSGGMAGKVGELLATDPPASVFDLEGLAAFLAGDDPGTTIY